MGNDKNAESLLRELFKNNSVDKLNIYKDKFGCYVARVRFTNPDSLDQDPGISIAMRRKSQNQVQRDIDRTVRYKDSSTSMRSEMNLRSRNTSIREESHEKPRQSETLSTPVRPVDYSPVVDQAMCLDSTPVDCDKSPDCAITEVGTIESDAQSTESNDSVADLVDYRADIPQLPPLSTAMYSSIVESPVSPASADNLHAMYSEIKNSHIDPSLLAADIQRLFERHDMPNTAKLVQSSDGSSKIVIADNDPT